MTKTKAKRLLASLMCFGMLLTGPGPAAADFSQDVKIIINDRLLSIPAKDQQPFIKDGRTYIPLRVVGEDLGMGFEWRGETRQIIITTKSGVTVTVPANPSADELQIIIDGKPLVIPEDFGRPFITEMDRTVIPVKAVGEALGCDVTWQGENRQVLIKTRSQEPSRGETERPDLQPQPEPEPEPQPKPSADQILLEDLAKYRTNLRLLDGSTINSADLAGRNASSFSQEQLAQFQTYNDQLSKYEPTVKLPDGTVLVMAEMAILGKPVATAKQLNNWLKEETPRIRNKVENEYQREFIPIDPEIAELYISIGEEYGIRGDLAFAQAAKETFYWQFTGSVQPFQNNYCGLWATGTPCTGQESYNGADPKQVSFQKGVHGAIFKTPAAGVEAHIQHLYAYATKKPLPKGKVLVDPRFNLVSRGIAPTWQGLNGRWAVPGTVYGQSIVFDYWLEALNQ